MTDEASRPSPFDPRRLTTDQARLVGLHLWSTQQGDVGRDCFETVLAARPDDPVAALHLGLRLRHEAQEQSVAWLQAAARADRDYAVRRGSQFYLTCRRCVQESAAFEDGWLGFLEIALLSGAWMQPSLAELAARPEAEAPIPRRIVQYWDEPQPPDEVRALIERCGECHPGWTHDVFDDRAAQDFLATHYGSDTADVYRSAFHVTAQCDLFRLAYLLHHGGFYVDADEHCVAPLDALRRDGVRQIYCLTRGLPSCIINGFIGTVPGSRIVARALDHCLGNLRNAMRGQPRSNVWVMTGPGALTFAILDLFCEREPAGAPTFDGFALIDDPEYRQLFVSPTMDYKQYPKGNWRLS